MKQFIKHITGIIGAVILAGSLSSCERYDYPDRFRATEGLPTVSYVRYADKDVFIDQAFMDEILCIVGTNLRSVHDIYFNDQKAIINTSYITDNTLIVDVTVGGETLTLKSGIHYPTTGQPPYALMIGTSMLSLPKPLFENRPIATMNYHEAQVNDYSQWKPHHERGEHNFDRLYPQLKDNGAYSQWAWGLSRLIDGLEQLGPEKTKINVKRIGVSGCSYAGKMSLFCGAFDERVALTIAQEPGGGGAASWRYNCHVDSVENLDRTDYHWFKESMREQFHGDSVYLMPYDHHELVSMICPRALLVLGNPDYRWLADESAYVSLNAARKVWSHLGIADRMGYSIVGGHPHCMLPESQYPEVGAFLDKFLLDKTGIDTDNIRIAPDFEGKIDLNKWIKY